MKNVWKVVVIILVIILAFFAMVAGFIASVNNKAINLEE